MFESRIPQKNRSLAAVLAFFVPGLGHYYQGRIFKASVYAVCIIGTYTYGMAMADGNGVYTHEVQGAHSMRKFPFLAQAGVGTIGAIAVIQSQRYFGQDFQGENIYPAEDGLDINTFADITYENEDEGVLRDVYGRLVFPPADGNPMNVRGEFIAEIDGREVRFPLMGPASHEPALAAKETYTLSCAVLDENEAANPRPIAVLQTEVPRSFINEFCMPPEISTIDGWYNQVGGKRYDLGVTLTMIAGLLNILAVWDAFDGPAHGYGEEEDEAKTDKNSKDNSEAK